jgi:choline dehydrogenase-like flavoprotein
VKQAIVVGSGAGGATVARELQGRYQVTLLEAGGEFKPLSLSLTAIERIKRTGLLLDEREIQPIFPAMQIRKAGSMVLVNGLGVGGTTTICAGNALRVDGHLRALGIDLDAEFAGLAQEVPVTTAHQERWREHTRRLYAICQEMGLDPRPIPKMGDYARCSHCGRCILGCPSGVKWDSRRFVQDAVDRGARLVTGCRVERVLVEGSRAMGVVTRQGWARRTYAADLVVLAAGGLGTPVILQRSGIPCEPRLFVDPVLCVATEWKDVGQCRELEMPFVVQREHYILSPYFDYLSFLFNRAWRYAARDTLGLMIKLADMDAGEVTARRISKPLTPEDRERLADGVRLCKEILGRLGVAEERMFLGTVNAGHPGGSLPLTAHEAATLHHDRLPANLYVADATLLPEALGNPPILTIMALAKRVARLCS